jgi:regulator of sigma E protease
MVYLGSLVLLSLLILIHEAGHLAAARLTGIPVDGFSVGLGPKLWSRRWGRTEYALRLLPLGGFVVPAANDESEFRAFALRKRLVFFLGGPLANLLTAVVLLAVLNAVRGGASLYGLLVAPWRQAAGLCWSLLEALPGLFSKPDSVMGVIGLVVEGGKAAQSGMALELAISLSLSLAVLNLLPIPILDGGQILLSSLEQMFPRLAACAPPPPSSVRSPCWF